jgi:hypothetical protein
MIAETICVGMFSTKQRASMNKLFIVFVLALLPVNILGPFAICVGRPAMAF